jgi:hypothetical protein
MSNLIMTFMNNSLSEFEPDQNSDTDLQHGGNSVITWPNGPLLAMSGSQECNISENLAKLSVGEASFYYCWTANGIRFGVKITTYIQDFDVGARPSWQIMYDQNPGSTDIAWLSNGSSPGDQYTWPASIGFTIMATPQSSHNALSIKVIINN